MLKGRNKSHENYLQESKQNTYKEKMAPTKKLN